MLSQLSKTAGRGEAEAVHTTMLSLLSKIASTFWEAIGTTGSKQKHSKSQLLYIDPCLVSLFGKLSYFQRASRSNAKTVFFLVFLALFFRSCFQQLFEAVFLPSWARFRTPCWVYVGSFLESFSLLRWGPLLKSFWHRFFIDFGHPWNLKSWALA